MIEYLNLLLISHCPTLKDVLLRKHFFRNSYSFFVILMSGSRINECRFFLMKNTTPIIWLQKSKRSSEKVFKKRRFTMETLIIKFGLRYLIKLICFVRIGLFLFISVSLYASVCICLYVFVRVCMCMKVYVCVCMCLPGPYMHVYSTFFLHVVFIVLILRDSLEPY